MKLDRVFPSAVEIGGESIVKAEGKFPTWPVDVDLDRDDVIVEPGKESGELRVRTDAAVTPGVVWIRMRDSDSVSELIPLLLEPVKVQEESEPNQKPEEATDVSLPCVVAGRLAKSGDVDMFRFEAKAGRTLVLSVVANRVLKSPMDAVAQLVDANGNVITQVDDRRGMDPQIVHRCVEDGTLYLRLFAFPETPNSTIGYAGAASFVYAIRVTDGPFVDHVLPLTDSPVGELRADGWNLDSDVKVKRGVASNVSPSTSFVPGALGWQWHAKADRTLSSLSPDQFAQVFESKDDAVETPTIPVVLSGRLGEQGEVDRYVVNLESGKRYRFSTDARKHGLVIDSVLTLVDPEDGAELARNDDASRNKYDAALEYTAKTSGAVELLVSDLVDGHGMRHAYSVVVEEVKPRVSLTVAANHFTVAAGASLSIPVTVSRLGGFSDAFQVSVVGLPDVVMCEAIKSEPKGASAKAITLKVVAEKAAQPQHAKIRIVGNMLRAPPSDESSGEGAGGSEKKSSDLPADATQEWTAHHWLRDVVPVQQLWLSVTPSK